ncbi:MAG: hydroxymethylglutaryl-CoA lyase [Betaproteobacteria bacterium HGW-Betaproteobacteria-9]|nr:MAG: hydroxymethylglutaryl-CoA lyase [Betaproteobacteria bacterium HGW-Betaproteobacteria-9]
MNIPSQVQLIDVGPRDGLQNEKQPVPAAVKIELVHRLQAAGLKEIEVTSYVSPKWVPQMADNHEVMSGITRQAGVRYSVLTPNLKGFEAALADQPDEIVVFGAASEAFSQKNINCSIAESIERFAPVVAAAQAAGIAVRGAMSCTVGCPYEGEIPPERVGYLAGLMKGIGVERVDVADTIGVGTPRKVQAAIEAALKHFPIDQVSGCPYAKGATGNVATEDVVYLLHGMGIQTGIDLDALVDAGQFISDHLGRLSGSRVARALLAKRAG